MNRNWPATNPTHRSITSTKSVRRWPTELGHPVEDVTPDRGFSALRLAVPRLQVASEHGLVSEEAVLNARLLSVARLLLPLPSPDLANPLKRRFTLRPGAVGGPRRQRRASPVRRETPDGNFERGEKIRECGGVVPAAAATMNPSSLPQFPWPAPEPGDRRHQPRVGVRVRRHVWEQRHRHIPLRIHRPEVELFGGPDDIRSRSCAQIARNEAEVAKGTKLKREPQAVCGPPRRMATRSRSAPVSVNALIRSSPGISSGKLANLANSVSEKIEAGTAVSSDWSRGFPSLSLRYRL